MYLILLLHLLYMLKNVPYSSYRTRLEFGIIVRIISWLFFRRKTERKGILANHTATVTENVWPLCLVHTLRQDSMCGGAVLLCHFEYFIGKSSFTVQVILSTDSHFILRLHTCLQYPLTQVKNKDKVVSASLFPTHFQFSSLFFISPKII